ncbi:MAG: hypothetical protein MPL62_11730, partial [Alphaproteobacteria bacterium]|nr:hypothetical protein [Alphaproteobacteria bacterium]
MLKRFYRPQICIHSIKSPSDPRQAAPPPAPLRGGAGRVFNFSNPQQRRDHQTHDRHHIDQ